MLTDNEKRLEHLFDKAMQLRDDGRLLAARALLTSLVEQLTAADKLLLAHAHVQLGVLCKRLGRRVEREAHFRAAIAIAPGLELASFGLFLVLFDRGRMTEALQEMVRFLRRRYSELYDELLGPRFEVGFEAEQQRLIAEARQLLARRRTN